MHHSLSATRIEGYEKNSLNLTVTIAKVSNSIAVEANDLFNLVTKSVVPEF